MEEEREAPSRERAQEGAQQALIPRVSHGEREKVCESSAPLSVPRFICNMSFVLPRSGVFPHFAGSLFIAFQLPLSVFSLASPAGHDDYEEKDHNGDTTSDVQDQVEKFVERSCFDNTESNLADLTVDIGWIRHLAGVGAIIFELNLSNYDGSITAHDIACPRDALLEDALIRRVWFYVVEKDP